MSENRSLFIARKEMNFINYFFEIVVPQLLEYFKDNAKDVPYSLLSEVLINNKNYEEEVKEMIEKSKEVSKKYEEKRIMKYHHKLLLADLLYVNYVHSNFEYDGVTIEEIYKFVTKGTRYNGLEQLEIIEEAKLLFKIKYNKYFT